MDDSVVEVNEVSVVELDSAVEDKENMPNRFPSVSSLRKQTRGGVKLDDTIELDTTDDRETGDGCSDVDETTEVKTEHFATANNTEIGFSTPTSTFKSVVTSTPAVEADLNASYEARETARAEDIFQETTSTTVVGEIEDEMYNSEEEPENAAYPNFEHQKPEQTKLQEAQCTEAEHQETLESSSTEGQDGGETDDELSNDAGSTNSYELTLPSKKNRVLSIEKLPKTCTLLTTENGGKVYLIGTAHFSKESQDDVSTVIKAVQPDIVLLEACKKRSSMLLINEEELLKEAKELSVEKMVTIVKEDGAVHGAMRLLLLSMSAQLTKDLGMAPGGEFRRAYEEARNIPGCLIHLGDRPIQITLKRLWRSLTFFQKLKIGYNVITNRQTVTKDDVEKYKEKDVLETALEDIGKEFPAFKEVLVDERDIYLAHSLRLAADGPWRVTPQNDGGPTETPVVVGVVGMGHVPGIVKKWSTVKPEDVARVVRIPPSTRTEIYTSKLIKTAFACVALYGGYRLILGPVQRLSTFVIRRL